MNRNLGDLIRLIVFAKHETRDRPDFDGGNGGLVAWF